MRTKTAKYQLLEFKLEEPLEGWVRARRQGEGLSWRVIAKRLTEATGIHVAPDTLRVQWFSDIDEEVRNGNQAGRPDSGALR